MAATETATEPILEKALSGERIDAELAERWGLVYFVFDDLDAGIEQVAGTLAKQSPSALREIKQLLRSTRGDRSDDLETQAFGVFSLGYGRLGPTEARVGLIALNTALALGAGLEATVGGLGVTVLDLIGLGAVAAMLAGLAVRAARNLRVLGEREPYAA